MMREWMMEEYIRLKEKQVKLNLINEKLKELMLETLEQLQDYMNHIEMKVIIYTYGLSTYHLYQMTFHQFLVLMKIIMKKFGYSNYFYYIQSGMQMKDVKNIFKSIQIQLVILKICHMPRIPRLIQPRLCIALVNDHDFQIRYGSSNNLFRFNAENLP